VILVTFNTGRREWVQFRFVECELTRIWAYGVICVMASILTLQYVRDQLILTAAQAWDVLFLMIMLNNKTVILSTVAAFALVRNYWLPVSNIRYSTTAVRAIFLDIWDNVYRLFGKKNRYGLILNRIWIFAIICQCIFLVTGILLYLYWLCIEPTLDKYIMFDFGPFARERFVNWLYSTRPSVCMKQSWYFGYEIFLCWKQRV